MGIARTTVRLGRPEEKAFGFAQAVRVGDVVYVSGQTGVEGDDGPFEMDAQMMVAYRRVKEVLGATSMSLGDIVEEVIYVTDLRAAGRCSARQEMYGDTVDVASTLIQVAAIGSPFRGCPALVEIKCTAARTDSST